MADRGGRPTWDEYFLTSAEHASSRATCPRLKVGAVVVRDKRVLSTGYNGAPAGEPHCSHPIDVPCTQAIHAEWNALDAQFGPYDGATMYLTHSPCQSCQRRIIDAGITRVVYCTAYRDPDLTQLERFGITVEQQPRPKLVPWAETKRKIAAVREDEGWPY